MAFTKITSKLGTDSKLSKWLSSKSRTIKQLDQARMEFLKAEKHKEANLVFDKKRDIVIAKESEKDSEKEE